MASERLCSQVGDEFNSFFVEVGKNIVTAIDDGREPAVRVSDFTNRLDNAHTQSHNRTW